MIKKSLDLNFTHETSLVGICTSVGNFALSACQKPLQKMYRILPNMAVIYWEQKLIVLRRLNPNENWIRDYGHLNIKLIVDTLYIV